ncbi:MAG: helix-turn-helix transcriptional regulator [Halobacteriota archaeon]|nr:helix-turn-helix transcriptional regulator [Halobacteriota archaeon]
MRNFAKGIAGDIVMSQNPGNDIRKLRTKYGVTQKELSAILELSRETVSRIENGKMPPSFEFVHTLANTFTLIEAGRAQCTKKDLQIPFFNRLSKEFGFSREKSDEILKIAIEGYTKKKDGITKDLER